MVCIPLEVLAADIGIRDMHHMVAFSSEVDPPEQVSARCRHGQAVSLGKSLSSDALTFSVGVIGTLSP